MLYMVLIGQLEGWGLDSPRDSSLICLMVDGGCWLDLSWCCQLEHLHVAFLHARAFSQ